jgi:hypothetical protein
MNELPIILILFIRIARIQIKEYGRGGAHSTYEKRNPYKSFGKKTRMKEVI